MVEGLSLDSLFELGGPALGTRPVRTDHLVDVGLCELETALDDLPAQDDLIQRFLEALVTERLDEVVDGTETQGILDMRCIVCGRDEDDICVTAPAAKRSNQLDAGHLRHIEIGQQNIHPGLLQEGQGIPPAVKDGHHLHAGRFFCELCVDVRHHAIILYDDGFQHTLFLSRFSLKLTVKELPSPGSDSMSR